MNSTITSRFQTTIPKMIREQLGISVQDSLEGIKKGIRVAPDALRF